LFVIYRIYYIASEVVMSLSFASNILPVVIGAAGGFLYYKFVGCTSGTCPITANPWSSTIYGAVMGLLIGQYLR
jgi:uncharacterized protein DUF6132